MKKIISTMAMVLHICLAFSQTSGGPDAYGYVWRNSNHLQGPTYNWIDITTTGTQVAGLQDDNSAGLISMGMSFHYYWNNYTQIKIGSNGWLSFNDISNISPCFPLIPTNGNPGDNILAPFMSDLVLNAAGSTSKVWYLLDTANEKFIVSYIDAPWFSTNGAGYIGSNTFQVILSNLDSSITFQYKHTDPANFNNSPGCSADLEIGIENSTGNIGLEVYNEVLPVSNQAVRFYYPDTPLIIINHITSEALLNENSTSIYPNPAFDQLNINTCGLQAEHVSIYDVNGKRVIDIDQPVKNQLNIEYLGQGIYIAEVTVGSTLRRLRWIKM